MLQLRVTGSVNGDPEELSNAQVYGRPFRGGIWYLDRDETWERDIRRRAVLEAQDRERLRKRIYKKKLARYLAKET